MTVEPAAFVVLVVAVAAPVCGHQTQPWPLRGAWRALRAFRRGLCASRDAGGAPRPAQRRSGRPAPSWAHTQPTDYEEAA